MKFFKTLFPAPRVYAHCDGPCGVYDPAQARVSAEAVLAMTKKILDLTMPDPNNSAAMLSYQNTLARYIRIKEDEAENTKHHLLVLWTDYFKPEHVEKFPNLHDTFWKAAKACSACKHEVSVEHAQELLNIVKQVHDIFWQSKGRSVDWVVANL